MNDKMYKLSAIFLSIISLFSLVMLAMIFLPVRIIEPQTQPYKIVSTNKQIHQGDFVTYQVDACKYMDVSSQVRRQIVIENVIYDLPVTQNNVPTGCNKTNVSVQIASILPPGLAHIELIVNYKVNALRDQTYYFRTEDFEIIP